jgi:hypothetical protein
MFISNPAGYNHLTGSLPTEVGLLENLDALDFGKSSLNHMHVTLPDQITLVLHMNRSRYFFLTLYVEYDFALLSIDYMW